MTVVDKPHRLPSMAHESNAVEHCGGCAERGLGLPNATLKVTHRLDSSTSGVLVLGKTESAVREFNDSVAVEYLDGSSRVSKQRLLTGEEAYCVQLLRMAFVPACWAKLD